MNGIMWHDIRKNPLDLPKSTIDGEHLVKVVVTWEVLLQDGELTYYVEDSVYSIPDNDWSITQWTPYEEDYIESWYYRDNLKDKCEGEIIAWAYPIKPYIPEKEGENA